MKWTPNVDCTPAEAREFLGLPDLRPMQSAIIEKLEGQLSASLDRLSPDAISGASRIGYAYQILAMAGWTSLPWLWTLKQPTLILAGRDDPIVPLANGRLMARLIPNSRLEILDEGHLFMVTRPVESAAIVEKFLAE